MKTPENPDGLPFRIAIRHPDETWTYTEGEPMPMTDNPDSLGTQEYEDGLRYSASAHRRRDRLRTLLASELEDAITEPRDFDREVVVVHRAAYQYAVDHDLNVPTLQQVQDIDQSAMGHVDWFGKLTLRVADLVVYGT